jgi:hypothetical protein
MLKLRTLRSTFSQIVSDQRCITIVYFLLFKSTWNLSVKIRYKQTPLRFLNHCQYSTYNTVQYVKKFITLNKSYIEITLDITLLK